MKRIWAAAGIALGIVVLCALMLSHTRTVTDRLYEQLDLLCAAEEGDPSAERLAEELCAMWEREEKRLSLHIRHSELEEVTRSFTQLKSALSVGEYDLFRMACDDARVSVDHLLEEARLSWKNVI